MRILLTLVSVAVLLCCPSARATFSIVAVDTVTGAVGGAGASCIAGCQMLNDIIEGVGAVHTQAWWLAQNQVNAHTLLAAGVSADSIISWLTHNDAEANPGRRQYGVVRLAGPNRSAAFTGNLTTSWASHKIGPNYSIQGNILLGQEIIDTIEFAFLNTPGPLEYKLMAALEAANVSGADTRCVSCNKPAISAFIKVVHLGDGDTPYLYEVINNTVCAENPVSLLRQQFDADSDGDGVVNFADNCPSSFNPDQADGDGDGAGNACDNCVVTTNPDQADADQDGIGDVCDNCTDIDNDGFGNPGYAGNTCAVDNCPGAANPTQSDIDLDGLGDACDEDDDGDGVDDIADNCRSISNPTQADADDDGIGDACCCVEARGNVNYVGIVDLSDLSALVSYLTGGGYMLPCPNESNVNGIGIVDLSDLSSLVSYLTGGGYILPNCP